MSLQLDWQQDLEDDAWPGQPEGVPPPRNRRVRPRLLIAGLAVLGVAAALAVGILSDRGQRAARTDIQEALAYAHWTLRQPDPALFKDTLDAAYPAWQTAVLAEWDGLHAAAQSAPAPTVESIELKGNLADSTVRWHDPASAKSYVAWRWFRLAQDGLPGTAGRQEWRWTQPVPGSLGPQQVSQASHLTLVHHERDAGVAAAMVTRLDREIGDLCGRYRVGPANCHFYLRWDVLDAAGQPLAWRDLALPPLAEVIAGELNGQVFIAGATVDDWHSARLRQRLQRFFPGRGFVSQSRLDVLRPEGQRRLPEALPGDEDHPIVLPTPWLHGVDEQGQPHPDWLDHVRRIMADAAMRRAGGFILGSPEYVNAAWALHQAVLATESGQPRANRLAGPGAPAPFDVERATLNELSRLGWALQSGPDEQTLAQLEDLSLYLRSVWTAEQVAALPAALGSTPSIDRALNVALGVDGGAFLRDWRDAQRRQARNDAVDRQPAFGVSQAGVAFREH